MAFDSSADLLFRIAANTDDAESNIARFRSLLSKDLQGIGNEFSGWAERVFGSLNSVKAVSIAAGAGVAAGLVAVGVAVSKATDKYVEYVSEVARASKVTGVGITDMSHLAVAADNTQTSMESLTKGLGFFTALVVKANQGAEEQIKVLQRLGVSREQMKAGEQNLYPLLEQVTQKFHDLKSGTDQAGMSRQAFGRGGTEMLNFLRLGRDGLRDMADEAKRLGLELTNADVEAVKRLKAAKNELDDRMQAVEVAVGRRTIGLQEKLSTFWAAVAATVTNTGDTQGMGFLGNLAGNFAAMTSEIDRTAKAMTNLRGTDVLKPVADGAKEAKQEFYGLSTILESIQGKFAGTQGETEKVNAEMSALMSQVGRATTEYEKLRKEGKLSADSAEREAAALMTLPAAITAVQKALLDQVDEKARLEREQVAADLRSRLLGQMENSFAAQERQWDAEMTELRAQLGKRKLLTAENAQTIADIEAAGRARIARERTQAFRDELVAMQQHQAQIALTGMTSRERIEFQYELDVDRYSANEERKSLKLAQTEGERAAISAQYALIRSALYSREQQDLQALRNSTGWQGVFGNAFGQLLRGNEQLMRQWATSTNQSLLMVRVTMQGLQDVGQRAFGQMAQGMGSNIAMAFVWKKSIGEAMRSALASTLETVAAESIVWAIYSTALGFLRLAQHDYVGAGQAFTSAAIWGSAGAAAAVAGRAVAPSQGGQTASGGASAGVGGGTESSEPEAAQRGPQVTVYVMGHMVGWNNIHELTAAINDAVMTRDVTLTATNTKTGRQLTK